MDNGQQNGECGGASLIAETGRRHGIFAALDRRGGDRGILHRAITVSEAFLGVAGVLGIAIGVLAALGFRGTSPGKAVEAVGMRLDSDNSRMGLRVDTNVARIGHLEHRVDTLANEQAFTNYMLCVYIRRNDPAAAPPGCDPIIQVRRTK